MSTAVFTALTVQDRCDACPAQAQAEIIVDPSLSSVMLCCHHFRESLAVIQENEYRYQATPECDF